MRKTEQVKQKYKYCCQNRYQQLSGRKEKPCSWGNRVNGWLPRNNRRIWEWNKCCKHLPSICDTSGLCSAWISSFYLLSTDLMLCHSVPKGSLVPPMLSRFVCPSLTLFTPLCSEGTTEACSYTSMTGKNIERRNRSLWVKMQINVPRRTINVLVCLLQPTFGGTACPFQDSRLTSDCKSLLSHSIWPLDEPVNTEKNCISGTVTYKRRQNSHLS